ncbi:MAG: hypothetical protein AB7F88_01955 [Pyrinomonadaceae bacterium]
MTSVNTSGNKVETKLFAGGAHIATQLEMNPATTTDDLLDFVTADPVTGTKATFGYTGGTTADIEEAEPLGQTIETSDPGTGYPSGYADVLGVARDPEWQCLLPKKFYGTFNEMPVHCKKAWLAESIYGIGAELAESDPKRTVKPPKAKGPTGRGNPPKLKEGTSLSPEALAAMRALAATGKFDNEEEPPDCGPNDCVGDSNTSGEREVPGFQDAGASGRLADLFVRRMLKSERGRNPFLKQIADFVQLTSFNRIQNISTCRGFFESINADALNVLNPSGGKVRLRVSRTFVGSNGTSKQFSGPNDVARTVSDLDANGKRLGSGTITINPIGAFFTGMNDRGERITSFGSIKGLSLDKARELIQLHEDAHIADAHGRYDDGNTSNAPLNIAIRKNCLPGT